MTAFVLIPGGWQGGWAYEAVAAILAAHGHIAVPVTLAGLGEEPAPTANLQTHIDQAIGIVASQSGEVVLVGHSYGGMVVSGVADAVPARIRALVYVDAYVPASGDAMWALTSPRFRAIIAAGAAADGLTSVPPPGSDPRFRPQPIGTFLQAIELSGRWREVPRKVFVGALGWEDSPFRELHHRLSHEPDWSTSALDCGHNVARLEPQRLATLLLAEA